MASITLKNLPEDLHRKLKERAAANNRSVNSELIACIRVVVAAERVDVESLLARARRLRARVGGRLDEARLRRTKREGLA